MYESTKGTRYYVTGSDVSYVPTVDRPHTVNKARTGRSGWTERVVCHKRVTIGMGLECKCLNRVGATIGASIGPW